MPFADIRVLARYGRIDAVIACQGIFDGIIPLRELPAQEPGPAVRREMHVRSLVGRLAFEFAPGVQVNGVTRAGIAGSQLRGPAALGMAGQNQSDIPRDALALFRSISLLQELPTAQGHGPVYASLASRANTIMTGQFVVADQGLLDRRLLSPPVAAADAG